MSFSLILPFLRPIEQVILDEGVSEVMVNAGGRVFVERLGRIEAIPGVVIDGTHLEVAVKNIARRLGDDISEEKPILDSRLPDGSRVAAVLGPCSVGGTTLTIRKFHSRWYSLADLVGTGSIPAESATAIARAVEDRRNILISGGTGTGKTTLLSALASLIPDSERIIVIEDTAEIQLSKPNLVRFEARSARTDLPAITIRDLIKASLRHRPDRLLVGEVRGPEAFDLLQALNTGHSGSVSTIHANSAIHAFSRLTNCVLEAGVELPYAAIRANIAASIDLVVQIERKDGKRLVTEVLEVQGYDHTADKFQSASLGARMEPSSDLAPARPTSRGRGRSSGR